MGKLRVPLKECESIRMQRESGRSIKEIAKEANRSPATICNIVKGITLSEDVQKKLRSRSGCLRKKCEIRSDYLNKIGFQKVNLKAGVYDPKGIGQKSEAQIMACFLQHDMVVLNPFGDNERYDLVVDERVLSHKFVTVQCKTARYNGDSFQFNTCSNNWNKGTIKSYKGEVDVFAVYLRETKQVFIYDVNKCPNRSCTVRLVLLNGQRKKIRLAEENLFVPGKSLLDYK